MKFSLERFHDQIKEILAPSPKRRSLSALQAKTYLVKVTQEKENIIIWLQRELIDLKKEKNFAILIEHCQLTFIRLLDEVFLAKNKVIVSFPNDHSIKQASEKQRKSSKIDLYSELIDIIEELLSHIQDTYFKFYNLDARLPHNYLIVTRAELESRLKEAERALLQNNHDEELVSMLLSPIALYVSDSDKNEYTQRRLIYCRQLLSELEGIDEYKTSGSHYSPLTQIFFYMNCNLLSFIDYFTRDIKKELIDLPDSHSRIRHLHFHLRQIKQLAQKPKLILRAEMGSLKSYITDWITDEINDLKLVESKTIQQHHDQTQKIGLKKNKRIRVELSVPQFGLLLDAFDQIKVLDLEKNKTLIAHAASLLFETIGTTDLSAEYLRRCISQSRKDIDTIKVVKHKIIELLNYLNELEIENK